MQNDDIRKILDAQEVLRRQLEPISRAVESIQNMQGVLQTANDIARYRELLRVSLGPLEDLRRSGYLSLASQLHTEIAGLGGLLAAEQRFRLPQISNVAGLLSQFSKELELVRRYSQQELALQGMMESMRTPWLDIANQVRSINGFAGLHGIGSLLHASSALDGNLAGILRLDLGDWREEVSWPASIETDPVARTSLYISQGFNPDLTTFPHTAFEQIVTEAGLRDPEVPGAIGYGSEEESGGTEREDAFQRTNDAHDLLQRFESQLRKFISEQMEKMLGPRWIRQRVPEDMRTRWIDKQNKDTGSQIWPIIAYADFTDYVTIITRNDNWEDLFEAVFVNKSSVQESFRRLYPIRLATMHARTITQDDELYLYVETKRILVAIGITILPTR